MKVKMILPALTEALSPYWRPIKYSLFPPLGLATLAGYLRDDDEVTCKPIDGEIHIPLNQLRRRLHELPQDRPIQICCAVGARAYTASRLLIQHGFDASLLSGGAETWFCVEKGN